MLYPRPANIYSARQISKIPKAVSLCLELPSFC